MSDIESDSHRNVTRVTAQCSRCDKPRDIVEATTAFLNRNGPATLTEIHGELKARGVEIGNARVAQSRQARSGYANVVGLRLDCRDVGRDARAGRSAESCKVVAGLRRVACQCGHSRNHGACVRCRREQHAIDRSLRD